MIHENIIIGDNIQLKTLNIADCNERYLSWLCDVEVNKFLETRLEIQSIDKIKNFIQHIRESNHSYLFAIIYGGHHVGNIKVGPLHHLYKYSDISYFIGEKSVWGKGIATESIKLITAFCFGVLKLNRIQAGVFEENIGSQKALERNNYKKEAVFRKKIFINFGDDYMDHIFYGILKDEWKE